MAVRVRPLFHSQTDESTVDDLVVTAEWELVAQEVEFRASLAGSAPVIRDPFLADRVMRRIEALESASRKRKAMLSWAITSVICSIVILVPGSLIELQASSAIDLYLRLTTWVKTQYAGEALRLALPATAFSLLLLALTVEEFRMRNRTAVDS